jgi:hypothetical protein
MSAANEKTTIAGGVDARVFSRILEEGYGPGAWHGNDLKAALADVSAALALWRPASGRHNIAELALHHAFYTHAVRGRVLGAAPEPFPVSGAEGQDFFDVDRGSGLGWPAIVALVAEQQRLLAHLFADITAGKTRSALSESDTFDTVLGITCHAVYHAGQVQLIKRLHG